MVYGMSQQVLLSMLSGYNGSNRSHFDVFDHQIVRERIESGYAMWHVYLCNRLIER